MRWHQLAVKPIILKGKAAEATKLLHREEKVQVREFIKLLGSEKAVAEWLEALSELCFEQPNDETGSFDSDNAPWLWQGDEEVDTYQGQSQVWDGGFGYDLGTKTLKYVGYRGPSGWGGTVERFVTVEDYIEWQSVKPVEIYTVRGY